MGEAFLVGGNSGMSNAGAVKSVQTIFVLSNDISGTSDNGYGYISYTIESVNVDKTMIITTSFERTAGSGYEYTKGAMLYNSNTVRVYARDRDATYFEGFYVQIVEFY